ncbi:bestrophin family protein [Foetidibacter luteolus]|uniref:bestrophin family protein n=1 Tax=Foetidibacter luteolus TaxID=2608880 RepID=UPI00129BF68B|nr:bestrophin family ion channel [Foetidibacter luteolus]
MISYNPKDWFLFLFRFHKTDTVRKLFPLIVFISLYSWFIAFIEMEYLQLSQNSLLKNIPVMHNLLGFAISMLLVFRTNTAYDRWWEGRKLWGSLINNSRNMAIKLNSFLPHEDTKSRSFFKSLIPRFATELMLHLQADSTRYELDDELHPELQQLDRNKHIPNQVAGLIMSRINSLYKHNEITGDQLIVLNNEMLSLLDICGACERIKNTPIPYSYSAFIKKFIFFYIMTLPVGYVFSLGYMVIPVVAFIFYVLASLELIAEEIEDPFGKDANDLPMQKMSETIRKNITEILA